MDTVFLIFASVLVFMMIPGLAFFYGGLVRHKNVVNTIMMSLGAIGVVGMAWALIGFSLVFGGENPWLGDFRYVLLKNVGFESSFANIPDLLFFLYQGTFAIVTAALISGAVIERMRFSSYLLFIALWSIFVYAPVAHSIWGGGFLAKMGVMDFAGGTVVHITAGVAGLVLALALGQRKDYGSPLIAPHSVPFTLLGTGFLWLGWFGFNGGSALAANNTAVLAVVNTFLAPVATMVMWLLLDASRSRRITSIGMATAIIVGCVAITPASGFVSPTSALLIGSIAAFPSYFALLWRSRSGIDDGLDVFASHGVGGITGSLLTGVFAQEIWGNKADGLLFGNPQQFVIELISVASVIIFTFIATLIIAKLVDLINPLRSSAERELQGLDIAAHGEQAYIADPSL
ncbi:MAG: ammonium transporter [Trueperaceae bacterium]|nr:ammonium transporter [Trueperaceae bacterium]